MKITQLFKIYWPDNGGGIAKVMESIAAAFPDCEQEMIVCQNSRRKKSTQDSWRGIPVRRCRQIFDLMSTPFSIQFLLDVKKRTKRSDIIIYHFPYPMVDLAVLLGLYSGRLVVWWHCGFEKYKKAAPLYLPLVLHTLKKADQILVSSKGNMENSRLLQRFRKKCVIIPYCVSDEWLRQGNKYAENFFKENHKVRILFVGRLVWYKGCGVLLRAFARMKEKNCELIFVGGGPLENELKAQAAALKLKNVTFTGMVSEEEKRRQIAECDFLVLPSVSRAEAFAVVQLEAMAFGKPVVNTALDSGVPYVSIDGLTGKTVKPGSVRELAMAMDELAGDEKLRRAYGIRAYKLVQKEYTQELMAQRHRKVFESLLAVDRG